MRLYNSLTRSVEEVEPLSPGSIGMYTCGPTVYRYVHLGNLRTFLLSDLVRRVFEFEGLEVFQVVNITDVGHMVDESSSEAVDKMQLAAEDEGLDPTAIARKYTEAFRADTAALGLLEAHVYPKATEHIPEMIAMIEQLLERGHAYVTSSGAVYYDVRSFPSYGRLSGNTLDRLQPGHRDLETSPEKRHHADFALWKPAGPGRVMKWPSPWGDGFPGWHIECSAMSMKYLGERFDLHTGGNDLKFPHHEDEIAQSEGAVGHQVVGTWVHGGHLRLSGQKIAKSAGNVVRLKEFEERGFDPLAFRLLTYQTRYRSEMDFSWEAMEVADHRVKQLRRRMQDWGPGTEELGGAAREFDRRFRDAVADDLDLPRAIVVLNELVATQSVPDRDKYALLASWDRVLGLDVERDVRTAWRPTEEMEQLVRERDEARRVRDFARADALRARLQQMNLEVMDTEEGTRIRPR